MKLGFSTQGKHEAASFRAQGDAARDARDWSAAAAAYSMYLKHSPQDFAILVQLGHVSKEAGDPAASERAYSRALSINPGDADLLLNYGRLLKLLGRVPEARSVLARSLAADFTQTALDELSVIVDVRADPALQDTPVLQAIGRRCVGVRPTRQADIAFDEQTGRMTLQGGDAWLEFALEKDALRSAKAGLLRFKVRDLSADAEPSQPSLYLDHGQGLSEETKCTPVPSDDGYVVFLVRPDTIKSMRWDPDDRETEIVLEEIRFEAVNKANFDGAIKIASGEYYEEPSSSDFRTPVLSGSQIAPEEAARLQRKSPSNLQTFFNYDLWVRLYDSPSDEDKRAMDIIMETISIKPLISFILPVYNPPVEMLEECLNSLIAQTYDNFEICIADDASTDPAIQILLKRFAEQYPDKVKLTLRSRNGHISAASNSALALASGDFVALVDHDDLVAPHALFTFVRFMERFPDAKILFSDEDKIDVNGKRSGPYFKTAYNGFLMYGHNMVTHLGVYDRNLVTQVGGFREGFEGSQDYDLMLRCSEKVMRSQIVHVPHVLYHWRMIPGSTAIGHDQKTYAIEAARRSIDGHFERTGLPLRSSQGPVVGTSSVKQLREQRGSISIIIPTRDGLDMLQPCVKSILERPHADVEILIVDNGSQDPATARYLKSLETLGVAKVLPYPHKFNYSAINNFAVEAAMGDIICFLNNDTEVISDNWLDRARLLLSMRSVGAVGAKLYYPDMTVQHFGTALGMGRDGIAGHIGLGAPRHDPGRFNRAALIAEHSAVTAACLFMRKDTFLEVGGFDETLEVAFNDVDLCISVREAGYLILADPEMELIHKESKTRGSDQSGEKRERFLREVGRMRAKWGDILANDPYYSPNLSHLRLDHALAYPPRVPRPWSPDSR